MATVVSIPIIRQPITFFSARDLRLNLVEQIDRLQRREGIYVDGGEAIEDGLVLPHKECVSVGVLGLVLGQFDARGLPLEGRLQVFEDLVGAIEDGLGQTASLATCTP